MLAQIPAWLETAGQAAAALLAVIALLTAVRKSRPVQWVWRTLVAEPATRWLRHNTEQVVAPVAEALVTHMAEEVELRQRDAEDRRRAQHEQRQWRTSIETRMDRIEGELRDGRRRFDGLDEKLDQALAGNPEVRRSPSGEH